ncbi:MAG: hypothetical protein EHM42_14370 [Planctomycetaceae bacterium]|nr:MAG: hypothetical protein EHM42_14370 [Planctomycetaceae bacterium]
MQRYRTVADRSRGGAFMEIDPDNPQVDRFEIDQAAQPLDASRFAVAPNRLTFPVLSHHPTIQRAIAGDPKDYDLPPGVTQIDAAGYTSDGFPWRVRCDVDGSVMGLVPAGPFVQGTDAGPENCRPQLSPVLDGYYIDLFEITAGQYQQFREAGAAEKKKIPEPARKANSPQEPVTGVTWAEARAYALWSKKEMPTESEWEKAARGTEGFPFPWGDGIALWNAPRRPGEITPVGAYPADLSPFGLFDMAGNAREWVHDWHRDDYYQKLLEETGQNPRNPPGPRGQGAAERRVVKGGDPDWATWARTGIIGNQRPADVGFRCVIRLKPRKKGEPE